MSETESAGAEVRRGRPRDQELRGLVLRLAAAQLADIGYSAMTMEGIGTASGAAKRTLYRWWPSKSAVVAEAILDGFVTVPVNDVLQTRDVWADLDLWLRNVANELRGSYSEVLRAASAIGATEPELGQSLTDAFEKPARANLVARLQSAIRDGQIAADADLNAVVDLLMAIIVFVGVSGDDVDRIPAVLQIIRSGVAT